MMRRLFAALVAIAMFSGWITAWGQTYPTRAVRVILPFPAGSPTDTLLRALGQEMTKTWGQAVLVDNRPGADTIIAAEMCKNAPPDGYTYCMLDRGTNTLRHLRKNLPFDLSRDFEPVTQLIFSTLVLVAHPSLAAGSAAQFLEAARARPGQLNFGSLGTGTLPHLYIEWIKKQYSVNIVHVPYKGPPQLVQSLLAGEIHATMLFLANFVGHIQTGKLRALGVSGGKRSPLVPTVPTLAEQGLNAIDDQVWFGLFAPAGVPRDNLLRTQREVARIFATDAFREKNLSAQALEPVASTPDEFAKFIAADSELVAELVRISGARAE